MTTFFMEQSEYKKSVGIKSPRKRGSRIKNLNNLELDSRLRGNDKK